MIRISGSRRRHWCQLWPVLDRGSFARGGVLLPRADPLHALQNPNRLARQGPVHSSLALLPGLNQIPTMDWRETPYLAQLSRQAFLDA